MAAVAVRSSAAGSGIAGKKKSRKPYVMSRPRERWTGDEHGRFLHALLLFGRDWKRVQAFVATKTATQIRSHAQKHFLREQKKLGGLAAAPAPPHPHPQQVNPHPHPHPHPPRTIVHGQLRCTT